MVIDSVDIEPPGCCVRLGARWSRGSPPFLPHSGGAAYQPFAGCSRALALRRDRAGARSPDGAPARVDATPRRPPPAPRLRWRAWVPAKDERYTWQPDP